MGTISKNIADRVIAGEFNSDRPVKIVKYTNAWGGEAYGLICRGEDLNKYCATEFVRDPGLYWELKKL